MRPTSSGIGSCRGPTGALRGVEVGDVTVGIVENDEDCRIFPLLQSSGVSSMVNRASVIRDKP